LMHVLYFSYRFSSFLLIIPLIVLDLQNRLEVNLVSISIDF
jgi:hypothetical protein